MRERGIFKQWNEVALICPRKNWFSPLADGLLEAGIPSSFLVVTNAMAIFWRGIG